MTEKTIKKVCSCVNCGNEAEMAITCTLESVSQASESDKKSAKIKGHGVCSGCGNEADMWLDLEEVAGV